MNKARRHELKMLKYKNRLRNHRIKSTDGNFYAFRSHGAPCSCLLCSPTKMMPYSMKASDKRKSMVDDFQNEPYLPNYWHDEEYYQEIGFFKEVFDIN